MCTSAPRSNQGWQTIAGTSAIAAVALRGAGDGDHVVEFDHVADPAQIESDLVEPEIPDVAAETAMHDQGLAVERVRRSACRPWNCATFGDAAATSRKGIRRTASMSASAGSEPARTIETSVKPECWPGRGSCVSTWMSMPGWWAWKSGSVARTVHWRRTAASRSSAGAWRRTCCAFVRWPRSGRPGPARGHPAVAGQRESARRTGFVAGTA